MNVIIEEKVKKYLIKKGYEGIVLKREIQSFGWAGCRDIIQGEFVKDFSILETKEIKYEIKEVDGIKVFIPFYLNLGKIKEIRISRLFSVFSKVMILNIETSEI